MDRSAAAKLARAARSRKTGIDYEARDRRIIDLAQGGMLPSQVAAKLGLSYAAVTNVITRARKEGAPIAYYTEQVAELRAEAAAKNARIYQHQKRCRALRPLQPGEADALVAEFLARREPTRGPTLAAAPTTGLSA